MKTKGCHRLTEVDKQFIKDNIDKLSFDEIANNLDCCVQSVRNNIKRMNLKKARQKRWDSKLCREFAEMVKKGYSSQVLAEKFNLGYQGVYTRLTILKKEGWDIPLFRERKAMEAYGGRCCLSDEEIKYIKENTNVLTTKEMSEWLGCSVNKIKKCQKIMGVETKVFSRWSPLKKEKMLSMYLDGKELADIAKAFNTSLVVVKGQINEMRKKGRNIPTLREMRKIRKGNDIV